MMAAFIKRAGLFLALLAGLYGCAGAGMAHDSWISKGGHRNAAGEWCCGEGDCFMVEPVRTTANGYFIETYKELVPQHEAQPSPDGKFWRCHRPDGSRRCFFAPPPSM